MLADATIYLGVAAAGVVSFLSPCVLPLVPPYLAYLGGTTLDQMNDDDHVDDAIWRRVVLASVCFVLGFTTVFVGLGAGASVFGQFIQQYKGELSLVAGLIIILFGLHFLGILKIPLLYREARYQAETQGASYIGAYIIGLAFAFGWTPCVGPILATVLAVAANEGSLGAGISMLFVYSLGLGVPFVLAAVAIRPFLGFMKRFRRHMGKMEKVMGGLLILTGVLFANSYLAWLPEWMSMNYFGQWMLENLPFLARAEEMTLLGLMVLAIPAGLWAYFAFMKRFAPHAGPALKYAGGAVLVLAVLGVFWSQSDQFRFEKVQTEIMNQNLGR